MNILDNDIDFDSYFEEQQDEAAKIRPASGWALDVIDRLYGDRSAKSWTSTGFHKANDKFELRGGEVTLWAGINKHGKTTMLSQIMLRVMEAGKKVCIMSLEMPPAASLEKMAKQAIGTDKPTIRYVHHFHKWTDDKLWMYDHVGKLATKRVIAVCTYARKELGIDHIVIDSLMKCGIGSDDYNAQKDFVDSLCAVARDTGLHIHLVAHMRKGENERTAPGKFDIKGAGEIADLVDNICIVWKNLHKIEKPNDPVIQAQPDGYMRVAGQRHFSWEGSFAFWFDKGSQQFLESERSRPDCIDFKIQEATA